MMNTFLKLTQITPLHFECLIQAGKSKVIEKTIKATRAMIEAQKEVAAQEASRQKHLLAMTPKIL